MFMGAKSPRTWQGKEKAKVTFSPGAVKTTSTAKLDKSARSRKIGFASLVAFMSVLANLPAIVKTLIKRAF